MHKLNAGLRLPLYYQLKQDLLTRINTEEFPDKKLPAEGQLCEEYGVSRMTVRQALAELERDGYEINDAPEERMLYEYDADGAHVFYLRADHRGMDFHRQYIIIRYKSIYIEVSCESTDRYLGDLIPEYIDFLKSAK